MRNENSWAYCTSASLCDVAWPRDLRHNEVGATVMAVTSASNTSSDTAEAGLFQTSYNAHSSHSTFDPLMDEYTAGETVSGFSGVFAIDVSCSTRLVGNYGSGRGC